MNDVTIVIPAYKPVSLLKECIQSIIDTAHMDSINVLVVCNGSDKESAEYLLSLDHKNINFIWYKDALGFTKAANIGLKHASTPYIVLLNTDVTFLTYTSRHEWVNQLINPLREDPQVSVTCAADMYAGGKLYFPFFCVGLQKSVLEKFNYLDEIFSPGYGEDIDFCFKTVNAGYRLQAVGSRVRDKENNRYITTFPAYHKGQGSFGEVGLNLAQRGHMIIHDRYFKQ
jgi:GT2 family glycosyltransferase